MEAARPRIRRAAYCKICGMSIGRGCMCRSCQRFIDRMRHEEEAEQRKSRDNDDFA